MSPISVIITIRRLFRDLVHYILYKPAEKPTMKVSSSVTVNRPGMLWHLP